MTRAIRRWGAGGLLVVSLAMIFAAPPPPVQACGTAGDAAGEQQSAADALRLLRQAEEARWLQSVFYRELHTTFLRHGVKTVARAIAWRPPAELRVEEDHDDGRRIAVWNGEERWLYDSSSPYVLHTVAGAPGWDAVAPPLGFGRPAPPGRVAPGQWAWSEAQGPGGRAVYLVEGGKPHAYSRYWIDQAHYFLWKEEHYGPGCQLVGVVVRSDLEFDPELPADTFEFEPPAGTQVVTDPITWRMRSLLHALSLHAPIPPAVPTYVPPGYMLTGGGVTEVDGSPALHLRFHDGQDLLSVFQVRAGEETEASPLAGVARRVSDGRGAEVLVMGAVREGYLFLVVGDLTQAEAERILNNLEFDPDF